MTEIRFRVLYAGHRKVDSGRELWEAIRDVVIVDPDRMPFVFEADNGRQIGFEVTYQVFQHEFIGRRERNWMLETHDEFMADRCAYFLFFVRDEARKAFRGMEA